MIKVSYTKIILVTVEGEDVDNLLKELNHITPINQFPTLQKILQELKE